jgi:hypothetical protein
MMFVFNRSSGLSENSLTSLIFYKTKDKSTKIKVGWYSTKLKTKSIIFRDFTPPFRGAGGQITREDKSKLRRIKYGHFR